MQPLELQPDIEPPDGGKWERIRRERLAMLLEQKSYAEYQASQRHLSEQDAELLRLKEELKAVPRAYRLLPGATDEGWLVQPGASNAYAADQLSRVSDTASKNVRQRARKDRDREDPARRRKRLGMDRQYWRDYGAWLGGRAKSLDSAASALLVICDYMKELGEVELCITVPELEIMAKTLAVQAKTALYTSIIVTNEKTGMRQESGLTEERKLVAKMYAERRPIANPKSFFMDVRAECRRLRLQPEGSKGPCDDTLYKWLRRLRVSDQSKNNC